MHYFSIIIKSKRIRKMFDNFFQDSYSSYNKVYVHPETFNCIFLGDMQSAIDADFLSQHNIKTVITAAKDMDHLVFSSTIQHVVYPLLDSKQENITEFFEAFYSLVEKNISLGNILVHCAAGISRSSTLVISYIMKKENKSFKDAIAIVRKQRPNVLPNLGFERQLKQYEVFLLNTSKCSKNVSLRRGQVKTSQSSKRSHLLRGEGLPHVSKNSRPKLNDILSINMKKLTQQFTQKDIKILKIYQNNRFVDNRKLFKQKMQARNVPSIQQVTCNSSSNKIPQRQSVSQQMSRGRPLYRKRIQTHLSSNMRNIEISKKLHTENGRIGQFNLEF